MDVDAYLDELMWSVLEEIEEWSRRSDDPGHPVPEVPWSSVVFYQGQSRVEGTLAALARTGAIDGSEVAPRMARFEEMLEDRGLLHREATTDEMGTEQRVVRAGRRDSERLPPRTSEEEASRAVEPATLVAVVPIGARLAVHKATAVTGLSLEVWSDRMRFHYVLQPADEETPASSREHMDATSALTRQHRDWTWDAWDDTGVTYRTLSGGGSLLGGARVNPPLWAESVVLSPGPAVDAAEVTIRGHTDEAGPISLEVALPAR